MAIKLHHFHVARQRLLFLLRRSIGIVAALAILACENRAVKLNASLDEEITRTPGKNTMPETAADNPLSSMVFVQRCGKPRKSGVTMMAEWGMDPERQANLLTAVAPYVDLAKIAVGIAALFPPETLRRKLENYRQHQITPFPGGMFLEHAVLHDRTEQYLRSVAEAGFDCIEVSDNLLEMTLDDKCELIRTAHEDYHLRILGEVGKKEGLEATCDLAEDAQRCLESGAEIVFLEAADFFSGEVNETQLQRVIDRCGIEPLIFELPGPWIKGITLSDIHEMTGWLLERFGCEVNIANVSVDDVMKLEARRQGIGINAGGQ